MKTRLLLTEEFRPGLLYKLVEWNHAEQFVIELLTDLNNDPGLYGVFVPDKNLPGLTVKVAEKEVAMLYFHLHHFNTLPHYFIASNAANKNETIARLVLDGIIEIKWKGNFVSGTAATTAVLGGYVFDDTAVPSLLSALSLQAIHYVWMQHNQDLKSLAAKMYTFNTIPWDAAMRNSFAAKHNTREFLFGKNNAVLEKHLDKKWIAVSSSEKNGWFSWARPPENDTGFIQTHKLFISPLMDDFPAVIAKSIPIINASAAINFKTGSNILGLLRPDKMVVYFMSEALLLQTAALLEKELEGCRVQGVPFSSQLDKNGLLSYGIDPPVSEVLDAIEGGSWRTTITDKLALAILHTKRDGLSWQQSLDFIKAFLISDSIDPNKWMIVN